MLARIYKPARSAMQSGQARTKDWVLEFDPETAQRIDPLMGWTGAGSTQGQVRLQFETEAEAVAYAVRHGIAWQIAEPKPRAQTIRPRGYGENFSYTRKGAWTH